MYYALYTYASNYSKSVFHPVYSVCSCASLPALTAVSPEVLEEPSREALEAFATQCNINYVDADEFVSVFRVHGAQVSG